MMLKLCFSMAKSPTLVGIHLNDTGIAEDLELQQCVFDIFGIHEDQDGDVCPKDPNHRVNE